MLLMVYSNIAINVGVKDHELNLKEHNSFIKTKFISLVTSLLYKLIFITINNMFDFGIFLLVLQMKAY